MVVGGGEEKHGDIDRGVGVYLKAEFKSALHELSVMSASVSYYKSP
jgi:hypothetical protein